MTHKSVWRTPLGEKKIRRREHQFREFESYSADRAADRVDRRAAELARKRAVAARRSPEKVEADKQRRRELAKIQGWN